MDGVAVTFLVNAVAHPVAVMRRLMHVATFAAGCAVGAVSLILYAMWGLYPGRGEFE